MMDIEVVKPGLLSTLQDSGRYGYQRFGVVAGGAMDEWSHRVANVMVGNAEDEATLEITVQGPSLDFNGTTLIAIHGADLSPRIGEQAVPQGRPVLVRAGSRLEFGRRQSGFRAYLAVAGGYDVPPVMNSRSTYLRGAFGGLNGRAMRKGDRLPIGAGDVDAFPALARMLRESADAFAATPGALVPPIAVGVPQTVRVIAGQQWEAFTGEAQAQFVDAEFRISPQSDRMGYRLDGPKLARRKAIEMISEAVSFGTVQVPPDGNPIVLMADRQTTGGYPKIAQVASVDLPLLAQMLPQQGLRFALISLAEAQSLYLARVQELGRLRQAIDQLKREA
ncbi:MAG: biotin-dependent carboxyltransferase family protein [Casimicrobiaceae bacterium]